MAFATIDVTKGITGVTPVANGGTALSSGFKNGVDPRPLSKPIIINGDCAIAQRTAGPTDENSSGYYCVDRMKVALLNMGEFRLTQETLSSGNAYNAGFKKAFRIDCQVADASPASGDIANMVYNLEGNDVQVFKKGTSSAETYTLAFWVKSNKTGTAQVNLRDADNTRMVGATYTISSANTWEHKVLNYPADTTGAFGIDSNKSLEIEWALDAGSDFTSGAVPSAWESSADADRSVNDLALQDNTANDWAITGIQLEVGTFSSTTLPPFQFESKEENLRRCARYFQRIGDNPAINDSATDSGHRLSNGMRGGSNSTDFNCLLHLIAPMRGSPSISTSNVNVRQDGNSKGLVSIDQVRVHGSHIQIECTADSGLSVSNAVQLRFTGGSGNMKLAAEL